AHIPLVLGATSAVMPSASARTPRINSPHQLRVSDVIIASTSLWSGRENLYCSGHYSKSVRVRPQQGLGHTEEGGDTREPGRADDQTDPREGPRVQAEDPGGGRGGRGGARLRRHDDRPGQPREWPVGQLDLLALRGQGRLAGGRGGERVRDVARPGHPARR